MNVEQALEEKAFVKEGMSAWRETAPSLLAVLRRHAEEIPDQTAYRFLAFEGEREREAAITFEELDRSARAIGALLQASTKPGDRVVLAYPPSLEYLCAFFGGLYAGLVVIPAYPPLQARAAQRLEAIAVDSGAEVLLSVAGMAAAIDLASMPALSSRRWIETDRGVAGLEALWKEPALTRESLAYLQYTSGSTGSRKGVRITHGNALSNLHHIERQFSIRASDVHLSWAPPYHDLGLIAGLLLPIYVGGEAGTGMSPFDFIQRPARWLEAIGRRRASVSGGPNFAYELCARKVPEDVRRRLDLSSWTYAHCGGEPIRAETIDRFCAVFGPCGFRREAFSPCYGSAETTLCVTGSRRGLAAPVVELERKAYAVGLLFDAPRRSSAVRVVGNGPVFPGHEVCVVDPETHALCAPDQMGELWIRGPVVSAGYWAKPDETEETCAARIVGAGDGEDARYLRSGDLGFVRDGEVFIAGRLKDLIIIRGVNHYPQDIELTVERCHPALRPGCGAAVSIERNGEERLAIVQEVRPDAENLEEILGTIRSTIREHHDLAVDEIALIQAGTLPKTTSGKVSRRPCRTALIQGELSTVLYWSLGAA